MTGENISKMIRLSVDKRDRLKEIFNLTKDQEEVIKEDRTEDLGKLLSKKDKLMEMVDDLDREFISLYEAVKVKEQVDSFYDLDVKKYGQLRDLKDIVGDINKILDQLASLDKRNIESMKASLDRTKSDLKQVKEVQRAYKGYSYEESGSILIDEKK
ncbi:MAG: flagellar export chaperone FlgN [Tissierellaceae bacterium]